MKTVNALSLRRKLGQILDEVAQSGEPVLVTRGNRGLVVLLSAALYEAGAGARQHRLQAAASRVCDPAPRR
jgi:prevent-host-death family protein